MTEHDDALSLPTEHDDALSLDMVTAALRADSTEAAIYARVLAQSLGEALPSDCVTVERERSMSDRMRGRPGEISKIMLAIFFASIMVERAELLSSGTRRIGRVLSPFLVYLVGYGTLLCVCTFASYVKELRRAEMTWDKTEKTGKVVIPT